MRLTYELVSNRGNSLNWLAISLAGLIASSLILIIYYILKLLGSSTEIEGLYDISEAAGIIYSMLVKFALPSAMAISLWAKLLLPGLKIVSRASEILFAAGLALILISPLAGLEEFFLQIPLPVIHNIIYISGVSCILSSGFIMSLFAVISCISGNITQIEDKREFKNSLASCSIYLLAFASFVLSYLALSMKLQQYPFDLINYYRLLFWGFIHISWIAFIQILIFFWLKLYEEIFAKSACFPKVFGAACLLNFLVSFSCLFIYIFYEIDEQEYLWYFDKIIAISTKLVPPLIPAVFLMDMYNYRKQYTQKYRNLDLNLFKSTILDASITCFLMILTLNFFFGTGEVDFTVPLISLYALDIVFLYYLFNLQRIYIGEYFPIAIFKKLIYLFFTGFLVKIIALICSREEIFINKLSQINLQIDLSPIILVLIIGDLMIVLSNLLFSYISIKTIITSNYVK
jgi:hypothetical protein